MATHMQAVETKWFVSYTRNFHPYTNCVEEADEVAKLCRDLQKSGIESVRITERRTCGAMPGLRYEETSVIDLTETIIKAVVA